MDDQRQFRRRPTRRQLLWASGIAALAILIIAILIGYRYGITLWDWIKLLIVPAVIAGGGLWYNAQQSEREQHIANERAQDEALQAYLDHMSQLLTDKEHPLRKASPDDDSRAVARARTLTVLGRLDASRKTQVMQFLAEAGLVATGLDRSVDDENPVISLKDADLRGADLRGAILGGADLRGAILSGANLSGTALSDADLSGAILGGTDMSSAILGGAKLYDADLTDADLSHAYLEQADLSRADLSGAILGGADLRSAILSGAILSDANLSGAILSDAYLNDANLGGADLRSANLGWSEGITKEELLNQAKFYGGATMPDGTIKAGQYVTTEPPGRFPHPQSFRVGDGWRLGYPETTFELSLVGPEGGQLLFMRALYVFDPNTPTEPKEVPAPGNPDEWVSWFQSHPNLDTSEPVHQSVGGASGKQIVVTLSSTPENHPRDLCGEQPCVPLYKGSTSESTIASYDGSKDRFVIVDVKGQPLVIDVGASEDKFEEFAPVAQKVLDTVEWQ